jgi:hypothetical protein
VTTLSVSELYSIDDRMINEHEAVGGMRIGRGNRGTRRKPILVSLYPPQIPHDLTWDRSLELWQGANDLKISTKRRKKIRKTSQTIEGFCCLTSVTGYNGSVIGSDDDASRGRISRGFISRKQQSSSSDSIPCCWPGVMGPHISP